MHNLSNINSLLAGNQGSTVTIGFSDRVHGQFVASIVANGMTIGVGYGNNVEQALADLEKNVE